MDELRFDGRGTAGTSLAALFKEGTPSGER
jgi:hypothetical protein